MLTSADPELAAKPIGDAARAVAASARKRAVVVVDQHISRGSLRPWITQNHHLIVAEARGARDGARNRRRRAHGRTAEVEHEDGVAGPVHTRDRVACERMAGEQALPSL